MENNGELIVVEPLGPPVFSLEHAKPLPISGDGVGGGLGRLSLDGRPGRGGGVRLVLGQATGGGGSDSVMCYVLMR